MIALRLNHTMRVITMTMTAVTKIAMIMEDIKIQKKSKRKKKPNLLKLMNNLNGPKTTSRTTSSNCLRINRKTTCTLKTEDQTSPIPEE